MSCLTYYLGVYQVTHVVRNATDFKEALFDGHHIGMAGGSLGSGYSQRTCYQGTLLGIHRG